MWSYSSLQITGADPYSHKRGGASDWWSRLVRWCIRVAGRSRNICIVWWRSGRSKGHAWEGENSFVWGRRRTRRGVVRQCGVVCSRAVLSCVVYECAIISGCGHGWCGWVFVYFFVWLGGDGRLEVMLYVAVARRRWESTRWRCRLVLKRRRFVNWLRLWRI